jgi:hypothetical protein
MFSGSTDLSPSTVWQPDFAAYALAHTISRETTISGPKTYAHVRITGLLQPAISCR